MLFWTSRNWLYERRKNSQRSRLPSVTNFLCCFGVLDTVNSWKSKMKSTHVEYISWTICSLRPIIYWNIDFQLIFVNSIYFCQIAIRRRAWASSFGYWPKFGSACCHESAVQSMCDLCHKCWRSRLRGSRQGERARDMGLVALGHFKCCLLYLWYFSIFARFGLFDAWKL